MGLESLELVLDKPIYYASETISGAFEITCSAAFEASTIPLVFRGLSRVGCTGKLKMQAVATSLVSQTIDIPIRSGKLERGENSFDFEFETAQNLPTSFETDDGYVRYWIEFSTPAEWPNSSVPQHFSSPVTLLQPIDTNIPKYLLAVRAQGTKETGNACTGKNALGVEVYANRGAFCPGENIQLTGAFRNETGNVVHPYVKLVQEIKLFVKPFPKIRRHGWELKPVDYGREIDDEIAPGDNFTWNETDFVVPPVSPTILTSNIQVSYFLEVGLESPSKKTGFSVFLPVVIGTIQHTGQPAIIITEVDRNDDSPSLVKSMGAPWRGAQGNSELPPPRKSIGFPTNLPGDKPLPQSIATFFKSVTPTVNSDDHFNSYNKV